MLEHACVICRRIDVTERPFLLDRHLDRLSKVGLHDGLGTRAPLSVSKLFEDRPVEDHRMSVTTVPKRTNNGGTCSSVSVKKRPHGFGRHERDINQGDQHAAGPRVGDRPKACLQRGQLAALGLRVDDQAWRVFLPRHRVGDGRHTVAGHDKNFVDPAVAQDPNNSADERLSGRCEWQQRLRASHTTRAPGSEYHTGNNDAQQSPPSGFVSSTAPNDRIPRMSDVQIQIRCQRCGTQMELLDPAAGDPWAPTAVLGLPKVRPSFLDDIPASETAKTGRPASELEPV